MITRLQEKSKIFNFLKTLLLGVIPAIAGGMITLDVLYIINHIRHIGAGSGWNAVFHFSLALIEFILAVILLYDLGGLQDKANKWIQYKKTQTADNTDSSSCDCETSNEATDTFSETKSKGKRKKS